MASKTCTVSAASLLVLLVANTFLAGQVAACKPTHHSPAMPSPTPPPPAPAPGTLRCPKWTPPIKGSCPTDTLKLAVCASVLGRVDVGLGHPPSGDPCCSLLGGLADHEAAVCLCTALKANILGIVLNIPIKLGIVLNIPIKLTLLLNYCGKDEPQGFQCA